MLYLQVGSNSPEDQTPEHTRMSMLPVFSLLLLSSLTTAMFPNSDPGNAPPPGTEGAGQRSWGGLGDNMTFPGGGEGGPGGGEVPEEYCQMLMDSPVPLTSAQVPWSCICSHCRGNAGPKGDVGERGLPGTPGSVGRRGLTGFRGAPGFMGPSGVKGQKGDQGLKGDVGPEGPMGPKGQTGYKGDKGDAGVEGRPGEAGAKGEEGMCPEACEAVEGSPGEPGLPGSPGTRGLPGPTGPGGFSGPKGDVGAWGPAGPGGDPGPRGEAGPEGDCSCEDGAAGLRGETGGAGEAGDKGAAGPRGGAGVPGEKGDMGEMGEMGSRGFPGPCMPAVQSSFSMSLGASFPPPNTPVAFNQLLHNLQGHYDALTGIYTAPVNGTYVFSYALTVYSRVLKVGMFHNFLPLVKSTYPAQLGTIAQQLVLHLAQGDGVWLQVKDQLTNGMFTSSETSSVFSGFLLHPDSCYMAELRHSGTPTSTVKGDYTWGLLPGPTAPPATTGP